MSPIILSVYNVEYNKSLFLDDADLSEQDKIRITKRFKNEVLVKISQDYHYSFKYQ